MCNSLQPSEIPHHYEQGFVCAHGQVVLDCKGCQLLQTPSAVMASFLWDTLFFILPLKSLIVLKLACADISANVISMVVANMIFLVVPVLFISISANFHSLYHPDSFTAQSLLRFVSCPLNSGDYILWNHPLLCMQSPS